MAFKAFAPWELYTPCKISQTCKNKYTKCDICNQTYKRQGLRIFASLNIKDYYSPDKTRLKR